ncbi:anti-sigma factor family protein [Clostridium formicaceticum]|uniref:Anti-sigma-W factor RsiW n=1 Tax=Clostridium formicaceticum TaxID=1497 RepID=A0AAC9WHP0_9CLOT|nr:zf-HC2 domain-containing protein [Clostridium formicaceticum]AOY74902.1 hypothetical protein BJL90_02370 [Clostridium formicaceticum]ARE89307.1 hypothetical protein CLFO_37140 [Clostridium formicaceticum]
MPCPCQHQLQDYLEEKLSPEEMLKMEEHIDSCDDCQQKLDTLLDTSLQLQQKSIEIDDEILIERIKAHRKGIRRIFAYGALGFLLGLFSLNYTSDSFIVTKAMMALPYKLAEFMLGIFFSGNKLPQEDFMYRHLQRGMGYFPCHPVLGLIVELITPALVAMFLAMAVGYLTSDKRVFQRKKILRFIASGMVVFLLWFGFIYGIYHNTLNKIENLEGIQAVTIYEKQEYSTSWLLRIDQYNLQKEEYRTIISGLSEASSLEKYPSMNYQEGLQLLLQFRGGGEATVHVDMDTGIMFMQNRRHYQLSNETQLQLLEVVRRENNDAKN